MSNPIFCASCGARMAHNHKSGLCQFCRDDGDSYLEQTCAMIERGCRHFWSRPGIHGEVRVEHEPKHFLFGSMARAMDKAVEQTRSDQE